MRIGFIPSPSRSGSVRYVMACVRDALSVENELVYLPPSAGWPPEREQQRVAGEFLERCDAIVGMVHPAVLEARQRLGLEVPYFVLMLGTMPRGGFGFRPYVPRLTTNDALIVNCDADRRICEEFFHNAYISVLPLAVDEQNFFPIDDQERSEIRSEFGFDQHARVVLYSGRITLEKNIHTVLRVFRIMLETDPELHLLLAGPIVSAPFREFGITPARFPRTLGEAAQRLELAPERVLYAGTRSPGELRRLYGLADLAINLSLHHDENFGLAQVEAMACGLPVVGSMWGGLKDTIVDDSTGYHVSTVISPLGVKVNWWEAVNRAIQILRDPRGALHLREEGPRHVARRYSQAHFRAGLEALLRSRTGTVADRRAEPLSCTAFAEELWSTCDPASDPRPPFRRSARAMELYQRLIAPYTGLSPLGLSADEAIREGQILSLAVPLAGGAQEGLWPDDPLFPLRCEVPTRNVPTVDKLLRVLRAAPAVPVERLLSLDDPPDSDPIRSLQWMIRSGLVLRSVARPEWGGVSVPRIALEPLFSFQRLPAEGIDFVVSA